MKEHILALSALVTIACSSKQASESSGTSGAGGHTTSTTVASTSASASSGAGGATAGSGGMGGGATTPVLPFAPGAPLTATAEQWTWVPFDNAFCGNGSPTGIGVNLTTASSRVLIYLQAGGACWSNITCNIIGTASNFSSGYGKASFDGDANGDLAEPGGFFDRTAAANPFKDYSYVFVPYCTGDIHAGANVVPLPDDASATGHFVGFNNLTAYLDRIVPTFPHADRVYLAGSSAGGFGAAYNWWHVQQAFGAIRVDLIDDSGTPMPPDVPIGELPTWISTWGLTKTAPASCPACLQSLSGFLAFYQKEFPNQKAALLSYAQDSTLPGYFMIPQQQFDMGLAEDIATYFTPGANSKVFIAANAGHVLWFTPMLTTNGVTLQQFLTQMVTDDPAWADEQPP